MNLSTRTTIALQRGVVARLNPGAGFGYVLDQEGENQYVFLIGSAIKRSHASVLRVGKPVKFHVNTEGRVDELVVAQQLATGHQIRLVLDPQNTEGSAVHPDPPSELPPLVREFGFMPSLDLLRPGDLLLVSETVPTFVARAIIQVQRRAGFLPSEASWHHAAVYLGNELICEAQRGGTKVESIHKYGSGTHKLLFRRDAKLSELESCKVALEAAIKLKYGYNFKAILALWLDSKRGWKNNGNKPKSTSPRAVICSQLFADARDVVAKNTLDPKATTGITPAHLATIKALADVPMKWLSVPKDSSIS